MRIYLLFAMLALFTSCVSNYKYQIMQKGDVNRSGIKTDSIARSYKLREFEYKIQTNDVLSIKFESLTPKEFDAFGKNDAQINNLSSDRGAFIIGDLVDDNGEVPFPIIGKVKVVGKTIFEIQELLQELANKYLDSPIVKVRMLNYRITFLGEVKQEGTVGLANNRVSMIEALAISGGFSDLADRSQVKLIRQNGNKSEVIYLNFLEEHFLESPYYYVHQNDVIIVPALKQRPFRNYFNNNFSILLSAITIFAVIYSSVR
jgi:polysaccharide biosynthesis/export protein